jgi:hypothetical protein
MDESNRPHGGDKKCTKKFVGQSEGKRLLGRTRRRWKNDIRLNFKNIGLESGDWIRLAQDKDQGWAVVNTVMNLRVP